MRRLRNRRGVTLILMAVSLVVLIGVAAFAVDFGQMYLYRSQLHAASDAAALAGVERLAKKDFVGAADTGVVYGQLHKVANTTAGITAANVIPGSWNFATSGPFIPAPGGDWTRVENNAVQATTNYTASYGFGRIFGATTRARGATSVAWIWQRALDPSTRPSGGKDLANWGCESKATRGRSSSSRLRGLRLGLT